MRKAIFVTLTVVLLTYLASIPAQAAEGVLCAEYTVGTQPSDAHGMGMSVVGHFLWLQHTDTPDSLNNIVSFDLDPYTDGEVLTLCTDGIVQGEVISTGTESSITLEVDTLGDVTHDVIVIASTDTPHPQFIEEWIRVENGWLIK